MLDLVSFMKFMVLFNLKFVVLFYLAMLRNIFYLDLYSKDNNNQQDMQLDVDFNSAGLNTKSEWITIYYNLLSIYYNF